MSSSRLRFKDTAEDGSREHRKKKRDHHKRKKREGSDRSSHSKKRSRVDDEPGPSRKWASSDEDIPHGDSGDSRYPSSRSNSAERRAREEKEFQQKLFDNLADEEQLDSTEAHFNDYAHIPHRWASYEGPPKRDFNAFDDAGLLALDPNTLDEEDYAEWVRAGMYRKSHAEEYAQRQREEAAKEARRKEAKARKAETARLSREANAERERKNLEKEASRLVRARETYAQRWTDLLADASKDSLTFADFPWPIAAAQDRAEVAIDDLTVEAVSAFLFPENVERKERLREAFLRFHPDKFEGRFMHRIQPSEVDKVRAGIGQVSRVLKTIHDFRKE